MLSHAMLVVVRILDNGFSRLWRQALRRMVKDYKITEYAGRLRNQIYKIRRRHRYNRFLLCTYNAGRLSTDADLHAFLDAARALPKSITDD
ncbi:hypothetical protein KIN20_031390 [Parelaphostrongylus tenuis]|uniref:Uncharacterized protein n=1 Tax=Parelaphostrongylus tenuis TaxID=148309 RepID=A0AAD5R528_PARTN|nr:hypothetical protein KIN20_031390 [Parelaphostrongylus tenuis]